MAAVTAALMGQLRAGDHVVAVEALFGSCRYIVEEHLPATGSPRPWLTAPISSNGEGACAPNTKTFFLETPTNPDPGDHRHRGGRRDRACRPARRWSSTTCLRRRSARRPFELGADCVVYSATKHIDGQGRCLGGIILGSKIHSRTTFTTLIRQTGPSLSPFNAWVLLKGLETLALRVRRQTDTAATVAVALAEHPKVRALIYPGRPDHPQAEIGASTDARRAQRWSPSRSRAARPPPFAFRTRSSSCASAIISATPRA